MESAAAVADPDLARFGFRVLRGALDETELAALTAESATVHAEVAAWTASRPPREAGQQLAAGSYLPAMSAATPVSVRLSVRLAGTICALAGQRLLVAGAQHNSYAGATQWHPDTYSSMPMFKVLAYLQPLRAGDGALRVLPVSHRVDPAVLTGIGSSGSGSSGISSPGSGSTSSGGAPAAPISTEEAIAAVPAHVVDTDPGDLVVFDKRLWHASAHGRHRSQWTCDLSSFPVTEQDRHELAQRLPRVPADRELAYDADRFHYYGERFRAMAEPSWLAVIDGCLALPGPG